MSDEKNLIDRLLERGSKNLEVLKKEVPYTTGLKRRPSSGKYVDPMYDGLLQNRSHKQDPAPEPRMPKLAPNRPDRGRKNFNPRAALDTRQVEDVGTHDAVDYFSAELYGFAPYPIPPETDWRNKLQTDDGNLATGFSNFKFTPWKSAAETPRMRPLRKAKR